ncbi:MAG: hypothetical protein ACSHW7_03860 [Patiriisocius sp.]|uniref:hypothetical protein n=1 Tax=Patiriisocius sp. TaxID=2822396 RepID=UPI003EF09F32
MKHINFLLLVFTTSILLAQEKIEFVEFDEIVEIVNKEEEAGNYAKAVELLDKIKKNDTAYCTALSVKSYYLLLDEKHDETLATANLGLSSKCYEIDNVFYINKAATYINTKNFEEGLKVAEEGLKRFPLNKQLNYNKAFCLEELGRIGEASDAYKKTILVDPLDGAAHLKLGNLCFKQELMTQALMCFNMYVMLNAGKSEISAIIESLNDVVASKNTNTADPKITISKDDKSFGDIDLILNQKIALNKKYDTGFKLDLAIVKQNHAMMTKLLDYKGKDGFWARKYVPFFKWVMENDNFDLFTYTSLLTIEDSKIQKIIKKNEKEIAEFIPAFVDKWQSILAENGNSYYYNNGYVQGVGSSSVSEPIGEWNYYTEDGLFFLKGNYNENSNRDGTWTWYYPSGIVKETAIYKDGKKDGVNTIFHDDGKKYIEAELKDDFLNGKYTIHYENGALLRTNTFKDDKLEGPYKAYFRTGKDAIEYDLSYKNDLIEGKFIEYHSNGNAFKELTYKEGKKSGLETTYRPLKEKAAEITYVNDTAEGPYKQWFSNGNVSETGSYLNDELNGPWISYHSNGTVENEHVYENGKIDGSSKIYNRDGSLLADYTYRKGEIIAYKFYDREGNIIKEDKKRGGEFFYESFTAEGLPKAKGLYDVEGGRTGEWTFFSDKGVKESVGNYVNDKAVGEYTHFYPNGKVKSKSDYKEDVIDGYYIEYHNNGQMNSQGWYFNGNMHGEWRLYYPDGNLSYIYFYQAGNLQGEQISYGVDEKIERVSVYDEGNLIKEKLYNEAGKMYQEVDFLKNSDNYTVTINHFNETPRIVITYKYGVKDGPYKEFTFDGNKRVEGAYINNSQQGRWTWFHPSGKIESVQDYVLNQRHGKYFDYVEDGTLIGEANYIYDNLDGEYLSFYDNGKIRTKATYAEGKRDGQFISYSPKGNIGLIRVYDYARIVGYTYLDSGGNEKPITPIVKETGKIKSYFPNGNISREMEYVNGMLEGTASTFTEDGKPLYVTEYKFDDRNGIDIEYYLNGNLKYEQHYVNDIRHGISKKYHENGKLKEQCDYKYGNKEGECLVYDESGKLLKKEYYFNGNITKIENQ